MAQKDVDQHGNMPRAKLTPVERTAVQVSLYRCHAARRPGAPEDEPPLFDDSFDRLVLDAFPEVNDSMSPELTAHLGVGAPMMAVRTVSIDEQLLSVVNTGRSPPWTTPPPQPATASTAPPAQEKRTPSITLTSRPPSRQGSEGIGGVSDQQPQPIRQVIILGAGLDNRAWRLQWPPGTSVYEVDTGSVEGLKAQVLSSQPLRCDKRVSLATDLSHPRRLRGVLCRGGVDLAQPVVWVMEGLIGYLTPRQAHRLLWHMHHMCANGSHLIVTAPPTEEARELFKAKGIHLKHGTFEEPEDTVKRMQGAGWSNTSLITTAMLSQHFDLDAGWQAQMCAVKEPKGPRSKHVEMRVHCAIS